MKTFRQLIAPLVVGVIAATMFVVTFVPSLGFADQAEMALVTAIRGVPHPPGFPAYVLLGSLWSALISPFSEDHIWRMGMFSVFCAASAMTLLSLAIRFHLRASQPDLRASARTLAETLPPLVVAGGLTFWHWANAVEVYAFHALTFALMLVAAAGWRFNKHANWLMVFALGTALGLGNHHLTTLLALPFLVAWMRPGLFPSIRPMLVTGGLLLLLYGWMIWRATGDMPYMFGKPTSLGRIWFHLSGGSWLQHTTQETAENNLIPERAAYFMTLFSRAFTVGLPLILMGWGLMVRARQWRMLIASLGFPLLVLLYQVRIYQFADTDAYLLLPFMICAFPLAEGVAWLGGKSAILAGTLSVVLPLHLTMNYRLADKQLYRVSDELMHELDRSAPKNSVVLVSDWTVLIQYHYYRIVKGFRPDLVVIKTGVKFANYETLKVMYPEFYQQIETEYEAYISAMRQVHPQELYDSGTTLEPGPLLNAYKALINRIYLICLREKRPFLRDAGAFLLHVNGGITNEQALFSGMFLSATPTNAGDDFIGLPYRFLYTPYLTREPAAINTLVDFRTMLDLYQNTYRSYGYKQSLARIERSQRTLDTLQGRMKQHIPFMVEQSAYAP